MERRLIPPEVKTFFEDNEGKSFLVKGHPGSGKTCFAFTLLWEVQVNGIYLSTRVSPEMLYSQLSWLKGILPPERIVDATGSTRRPYGGESIVIKPLKYTDVPEFLKGVYEKIERLKYPVVIIDSWDAVLSHTGHYEPREKERLEHNICDFARKTGTKMVFIAEYLEQKPLDYLVDGVVVMESDLHEGKRIRRMILQKMRGCPIRYPFRLFSLEGGMFKYLQPFEGFEQTEVSTEVRAPILEMGERSTSTGIKDLDVLINGYGSFNLFKGDRTVYELLILPFIINSLSSGKRIVLNSSEKPLIGRLSSFVSSELLSRICFQQNLPQPSEDTSSSIYLLNLNLLNAAEKVAGTISSLIERGALCHGFISGEREVSDEVRSLASRFLVLEMISRVPCLYGEPAPGQIHALELKLAGGVPEISLVPII